MTRPAGIALLSDDLSAVQRMVDRGVSEAREVRYTAARGLGWWQAAYELDEAELVGALRELPDAGAAVVRDPAGMSLVLRANGEEVRSPLTSDVAVETGVRLLRDWLRRAGLRPGHATSTGRRWTAAVTAPSAW